MKVFQNPAQNLDVFQKNYGVWQAAKGAITAGTIIAILTEFAISNMIVKQHAKDFFDVPDLLCASIAFIFVCFLAIERIRYGRQLAKMYTDEESRKLGFDANGLLVVACFAVYGVSIALSYIGSISAVQSTLKQPEIVKSNADSIKFQKIDAINRQYTADSAALVKTWNGQIQAEKNRHQAVITSIQKQVASGKYWLTAKLESAKSEKQNRVSDLTSQKASELLTLTQSRQKNISDANNQSLIETEIVNEQNISNKTKYNFLSSKAEKYIPCIAIIAIVLLFFGLVLDERFKHAADIKEIILPNEYDHLPSIGTEFKEAFKSLFNGWLRGIALSIKSFARPSSEVVENSVNELVFIELNKYKQKVLQYGESPEVTHQAKQQIGFKQQEQTNEMSRNYGNNDILELFNTYKLNRQLLKAYEKKQQTNQGKPETISAGIQKHRGIMNDAESALLQAGFKVQLNQQLRKLELVSIAK